ncbi:MAG: hypothetical protein JSS72_06090 [Armatimonadetes bacterium]|nr:hypothetical protein [Armatimonadota bacterium]
MIVAWNVSKKIVKFGFFVLYFLIGCGLVEIGSFVGSGNFVPWQPALVGGLAFAVLVKSVRSKVMRVVGVVTAICVVQFIGLFLMKPLDKKLDAKQQGAAAQKVKGQHETKRP